MAKIAASVLLKLFINGYKRCHTTYGTLAHEHNFLGIFNGGILTRSKQ